MRSRVTLAMIEAAAIETERASPSTMRVAGAGQRRRVVAVHQREGGRERKRPHRARHGQMRRLADVDEVDFVHARFADADTAPHVHDARVSASRASAVICLELLRPLGMRLRSRITAAATTGPGERPAPGFVHAGDGPGHLQPDARFEDVMRHRPWAR